MNELDRARSALNALDPGIDRANWIRTGMSARAAGLTVEDFTDWSRSGANFKSDRDCTDAWKSFSDGPVKSGTLYRMAFDAGWKDPGNGTPKQRNMQKPTAQKRADRLPATMPAQCDPLVFWSRCQPAPQDHAYIRAKKGQAEGLRMVPNDDTLTIAGQSVAGWLAVPATSADTTLRTLQLIPPPGQGKKLNLPGAHFGDGCFIAGPPADTEQLFLVEGIGQAWACWRATGSAAVVCFGSGRMAAVASAIRLQYPDHRLIVVPDRGKETEAEALAREIRGAWVELPTDKASNYDAADYAQEFGDDKLALLLSQTRIPTTRYRLLSAPDLMNMPPLPWLVRGVLPAAGLACLYGASASGKSFLALDLCAAVAGGGDWFGYRVYGKPVVYVALEGEGGFTQRVQAWQVHHRTTLPARLHFIMQPFALRNMVDVQELAEAVNACGAGGGLLVIDTLNRAAGGADENSSSDMGQIIDATKALQTELGGLVLLVHHSGKDSARGMRGHSSLFAALDAAIEVVRSDGKRDWRIAKNKNGDEGEPHPFRLEVVDIGDDEEGAPLSSCVIIGNDSLPVAKPTAERRNGATQELVRQGLRDLLQASTIFGKAGAPTGRPCVELERAVEETARRLTCKENQRQYQARRAIAAMTSREIYQVREGWLWMA